MCGIAGWMGDIAAKDITAKRVRDAMLHRGPDEQRIFHYDQVTFIHNRLKILDLTSAGAQPMNNEENSISIIFNGEIYNHEELREKLIKKGFVFKSRTDTEVILRLYEDKGEKCIDDLRGMFAFAIYDKKQKSCLLARDRTGIKPLFYSIQSRFVAFASEINTLKKITEIPLEVDEQAVFDYTSLFFIPAPLTFYKAIRALEPGQSMRIDKDLKTTFTKGNKFNFVSDTHLVLSEAVDRCENLLNQAVKSQLRSDVPLGVLLSGGIDSSLVAYFAQNNIRTQIETFCVGFSEPKFDESWAAAIVAKKIRSDHRVLSIESNEGQWSEICSMLIHAGQPYADSSVFAVNELSRLIRQRVTVALAGDGGDEGFGGYNFFKNLEWNLFLLNGISKSPKFFAPLLNLFSFLKNSQRIQRVFNDYNGADDVTILQQQFTRIREKEHFELWQGKSNLLPVRRYFEPVWNSDLIKKLPITERFSSALSQCCADLLLANDFLFKVDIASMRHGLEIRVPMLDEELYGFSASLSYHMKAKGGKTKRVLRELAKKFFPESIYNRSKKGFSIPFDTWVNADFKIKVKNCLKKPKSFLRNFIRPKHYEPWVDAFSGNQSGIADNERIVMLLSLELHNQPYEIL